MFRNKLIIFLLLICPTYCWATKSKIISSYVSVPSTSAARYYSLMGPSVSGGSSEALRRVPSPTAGTLGNLHVSSTDPTTASSKYTFTVYVNAGATALTCDIAAGSTSCNYTVSTAAVTAGQTLSMRIDPVNGGGGAPASVRISWNIEFDSTTAGETILLGDTVGSSVTADDYMSVSGSVGGASSEAGRRLVIPTAGTIKSMYVLWSAAPGGAAGENIRTVTLWKNGGAESLTCSTEAAATTCNDTSNTEILSAGDLISYRLTVSGTVANPAAAYVKVSAVFVPLTPGEFPIMYLTTAGSWDAAADNYGPIIGASVAPTATESEVYALGWSDFQIKGSYCVVTNAPGVGKSWTFHLRKDGGDVAAGSDYDCTITGAATAAASTDSTPLTLADGSLYDSIGHPSGTPSAPSYAKLSYIGYIAPPAAGNVSGLTLMRVGR